MRLFLLIFILISTKAFSADGMINVASEYNVKQTADRFERIVKEKGMTVFNRINHAEGAKAVDIQLRPTELIIFGNPKVGSPLMACQQSVALDLPQKALIWQDVTGKVWLSYNDPEYILTRHVVKGCGANFDKVKKALAGLTKMAAQGE